MGDKAPAGASPLVPPVPLPGTLPPIRSSPSSSFLAPLTSNPIARSLGDAYAGFQSRRAALGLSNPGGIDNISKEVTRDVFLNNLMFGGFRAEFNKVFSSSPLFQTAHSFAMGGNGGMPPYSFAVLYGSPKVFMQGNIDNEFQLSSRFNYRLSKGLVAKSQLSLAPGAAASQSMVQLEADYAGSDFTANIKAMNPSVLDSSNAFTGVVVASYLQSVTPSLALGLETMWQRPSGEEGPQTVQSYAARYKGKDWIASAQLVSQGSIQASYWRRLSDKVEAGVDLNLSLLGLGAAAMGAQGPMAAMLKNEGNATIGAKYDFRMSSFRGQIDSAGKVSALLEKRLAPMVSFTFAGEMDHAKNAAKIGMQVQIESAGTEEFAAEQERVMTAGLPVAPPESPPF